LQFAPTRLAFAATSEPEDTWASLANDIFKGRPPADGTGLVSIEMPARAEDAAIVPVTMRVRLWFQPSGGRTTQNTTPLLTPSCLGAQT
jgi:sulfur-oxidizing protein SoxY